MLGWLRRLFGGDPPLVQQSRSANPEDRYQAAVEVGTIEEPWVGEVLMHLLQDTHQRVRDAAREGLRQQKEKIVPDLFSGLNSANVDVAVVCAELVGELQPAEGIERLLIVLKFGERAVQLAAKRALEQYGPIALPMLRRVSDESQPWVRQQIQDLLSKIEEAPAQHDSDEQC